MLAKSENIQSKLKESEFRLKEYKTIKETAIQRQKRQWEDKQELISQLNKQTQEEREEVKRAQEQEKEGMQRAM